MAFTFKKLGLILSVVFGITAILVAYFWPIISNIYPKLYFIPSQWPTHASANLDKRCTFLDKSIYGCEDLVVHHDYVYMACSSQENRNHWFPPLARLFHKTPPLKDPLYVFDLSTNKLTKLNILKYKLPDLTLHGLSVIDGTKPNKIVLAAINHRRSGESCVELFDHRTGTDELIYVESICDPLISSPNGLVLKSPSSFFLTNFLQPTDSEWEIKKQLLFAHATGSIVYADTKSKSVKLVRDHLKGANGITLLNPSTLAVTETSSGELSFWSIQADHSLRQVGPKLSMGLFPDNIKPLNRPDGGLIITGPIASWPYLMAYQSNFTYPGLGQAKGSTSTKKKKQQHSLELGPGVPSAVVVVHNSTNINDKFFGHQYRVTPVLVDPKGTFLYSASVTAVHFTSKRAFIGGPYMRGVVVCEWPEPLPVAKGSKVGYRMGK